MPEKIKKSIKIKSKKTGKYEVEHYYLKTASIKALKDLIADSNTTAKIKLKCKRELQKRNG